MTAAEKSAATVISASSETVSPSKTEMVGFNRYEVDLSPKLLLILLVLLVPVLAEIVDMVMVLKDSVDKVVIAFSVSISLVVVTVVAVEIVDFVNCVIEAFLMSVSDTVAVVARVVSVPTVIVDKEVEVLAKAVVFAESLA